MLAGDERLARIPSIVFTGRTDPDTLRRCQRLGVHYVLKSDGAWDRLEELVCDLLAIRPLDREQAESLGRLPDELASNG
jgi:DNA-binding NarL/FixJ family response regulator